MTQMDPLSMPQDDQHATDDVDISQEDLDFFQEHAEYLPVLAGAAAAVTGYY